MMVIIKAVDIGIHVVIIAADVSSFNPKFNGRSIARRETRFDNVDIPIASIRGGEDILASARGAQYSEKPPNTHASV